VLSDRGVLTSTDVRPPLRALTAEEPARVARINPGSRP